MKKSKLTFGIPMYNSEKYILDLINCFDFKNYEIDYEILIVDDGSNDSSCEICKKIVNSKIRIISKKNGGVSSARNCILDNAQGEWITFVDSDDIIDFKEYVKVFKKILDEELDFYINIKEKIYKKYSNNEKILYQVLIEKEIINSPCMKFYKKLIIDRAKLRFEENIDLGEDLIFNISYFNLCRKVGYFNNYLYNYRMINSNSLTQKYRKNKFEILMNVYQQCVRIDSKHYNIDSFEYIRVKNCISCIKDMIKNGKEKKEILNKISIMKKYKLTKEVKFALWESKLIYVLWYTAPNSILMFFFNIIYHKWRKR